MLKPGIGTVDGYKWSRYRDYIGMGRNLTDAREVLGILSNFNEKALIDFVRFNHEFSEGTFLDVREEKDKCQRTCPLDTMNQKNRPCDSYD